MSEDQKFEVFAKSLFRKVLDLDPQKASYLGFHEYDGRIIPISNESLKMQNEVCSSLLKQIDEFDRESLSSVNRFDLDTARWGLESWLFSFNEMKTYKHDPMQYVYLFSSLHGYIGRNYAPFDERFASINNVIRAVPEVLEEAAKQLDSKLPNVLCDFAISFSKGYKTFFTGELQNVINANSKNETLQSEYKELVAKAIAAIDKFIEFLKTSADAECRSNILGEQLYSRMLQVNEHIDLPVQELKVMAQQELERLQKQIKVLEERYASEESIFQIEHEHPTPESLVKDTTDTLSELVDFIRDKDIVYLPERLNCIVDEMPKYMNFGFAAMDTAGPFEKSDESYYYVNLPDADWDSEKTEEWMTQFNYPTLKLISIHEAYPGHYTHFLNANKFSTDVSKLFMSYSYVEGWAHYTEEMMLEQGYGTNDYKTEVGMLLEALIRCCRFVVSIGIHCEGMTLEEAKDFFIKNAYMAEATAEQEAKRGEFDPGYLNYTLGKILLKDFKTKYFIKFGSSKTIKDFHNAIVALGAPTFRIAEDYIMQQ